MRKVTRLVSALGVAGTACVAYGTFIERRWYRFREVTLAGGLARSSATSDGRPDAAAGDHAGVGRDGKAPVRILHLSDLHVDPPEPELERFLASLTALEYDVVAVTGDLLGWQDAEEDAADLVGMLTSDEVPGVVVLGSNDLYGPRPKNPFLYLTDPEARVHGPRLDTPRLIDLLAERNCHVLQNNAVTVDTPAGRVAMGGIDDPHLQDTVIPPVDALRPTSEDVVLQLGLVHAPYTMALDRLREAGYHVLLSGHTHGGQVRFPPIGALVANCDLPLDQIRGASRYDGAWLHVSPGLGTSRYAPFRFACRPEATLLRVTP